MKLRYVQETDMEAVRKLHAQMGMDYEMPDLFDGTFIGNICLEDDAGQIVMVLCARRIAEMFLLCDNTFETPGFRLEAFKKMSESMRKQLANIGVKDAHALLPPKVAKSFSRRLASLGWWKPTWELWARRIR